MQFSVPQFTDVEDKIIGPLTIKQFGILFGAGIVIFTAFSVTKSTLVGIFFGLLIGLPALGLAFAKLNGRPMYNMIGHFLNFLGSAKVLVFHKEIPSTMAEADKPQNGSNTVIAAQVETEKHVSPQQRLAEINRMLEEKAREEQNLLKP